MNVNRRDFIGGTLAALGFSALPGGLIFAAKREVVSAGMCHSKWRIPPEYSVARETKCTIAEVNTPVLMR